MKKCLKFCVALCIVASMTCAFAKKNKKEPAPQVVGTEIGEDGQEYQVLRRAERKKGFLGFGVDVAAIEMGTVSLSTKKTLPGQLNEVTAVVSYYPTQDEIVIQFKQMMMKFFPCFDESLRVMCATAFTQYCDDFENKRLDKNSRNVEKIYGHRRGRIRWGLVNGAQSAKPDVKFGYEFIKKSPYFKITFDECVAEHPGQSEKYAEVFHGMTLLFNRAQMRDLLSYMEQSKIDEAMLIRVPVSEQEKRKDDVYDDDETPAQSTSNSDEYQER